MKNNKRGDFDFEWLFALIAGAVILVLAVYGAMKIGDTAGNLADSEIAKQISIITDPLQAGFASGSFGKISFNQEVKVTNTCFDEGFGKNDIGVSTKTKDGWRVEGQRTSIHNKYIFSPENSGKVFYVFSKPFFLSYKVADLIMITSQSQDYCFVSAPQEIEDELKGLNIPNVQIGNCSDTSLKVCFNSGNCDVGVYGTCMLNCESRYDEGYVEKDGMKMDYTGSLMYAAIFSDKGTYDCNVKRLLYRTSKIADVFSQKAELMNLRGCNTNMQADLLMFESITGNASVSNIISINQIAKDIEIKNEASLCRIW